MGKKRTVAKVDPKSGEIIHQYESISRAALRNGVRPASIQAALTGRCLAAGYEWIYTDQQNESTQ